MYLGFRRHRPGAGRGADRLKNINDNYWMESIGSAPGCGFSLLHAGNLMVYDGTVYRYGGYCCWHVVTAGRGFVRCHGCDYSLEPGDVFSVFPDCEIEYGPMNGKQLGFIYLRLEGPQTSVMLERIGLSPETPVRAGGGAQLIEMFREVWLLAKNNCPVPEEYAVGILKIMSCLNSGVGRRRTAESLVQEALRLIKNPVGHDYNVNELAESLHVSRVNLFSAFRKITGHSPKESIQLYRQAKYRDLIARHPGLSISELSELAGFRDSQSFIRFFSRTAGMTPGEYRRSIAHPRGSGFSPDPE